MLQDLLVQLLMVIAQIIIVVVGGYVINFLKAKIGAEDLNKYYNLTSKIVTAVEQTFGPGNGADKKEEAVQLIKKITKDKLSDDQIEMFIEAAVFQMNQLVKENIIQKK